MGEWMYRSTFIYVPEHKDWVIFVRDRKRYMMKAIFAPMLSCIITRDFTMLDLGVPRATTKERFTSPPFETAGGDELWTTFSP
jgi:predicted amidophosphoribosyltransferase